MDLSISLLYSPILNSSIDCAKPRQTFTKGNENQHHIECKRRSKIYNFAPPSFQTFGTTGTLG